MRILKYILLSVLLFASGISFAQTYYTTGAANLQRTPTSKGWLYSNNIGSLLPGRVNWYTAAQLDSLFGLLPPPGAALLKANNLSDVNNAATSLANINGVSLLGSYANPPWITSLAWGKITGTPTTLGGYGITDGITTTTFNTTTGTSTLSLLAGKQATLVSGTNIKTVNSTSLLGSGDIPFPTSLPTPFAATFNNSGSGAASGTTFDGSVPITISYNTIGAQVAGTYLTPSSTNTITNKDLTSGTNTFPIFNQNTTGTASNLSGTPALPNGVTATTQTTGENTAKLATDAFVNASISAIGIPTLQSVASAGNSYTAHIQAQAFEATGTANTGYFDMVSQSTSPASLTGHLRLYSDSVNRFSWKNSNYRRTIRVPYPSDFTINMPYLSTSTTLEDSTHARNTYVPTSRTLTINGTTQDLSANRTYTVTAALANALTFNNTGAGAAPGTVFDGTVAKSISYNTIGAAPSNAIYPNRIKLLWSAAFNGFGNSIMAGSSASSSTNYFINQFALLTNTSFTNYAVAGTGTKELTSIYYSHTSVSGATVPAVVEIGTNNLVGSIGQTRQAALKASFNNLIVNQFTDTVIAASNARITRAGTWAVLTTANTLPSKSAAYSLGTPYKSSVAGSTMSFTWYGTNLYVLTYGASPNHSLGSFKITVDGVDRVTYDENGKGDDWYYPTFGTYDFRTPNAVGVTGLSIGGHSVVITVLQNLEVDIDAIARVLPAGSCAPMQISHILYSTPAGYTLGNAHSSTLAVDTANAGIDSLVYSWQKMNYPVTAAVLERWVNPTTDFAGTDGFHPNNSGHLHIAQALFDNVIPYGISNSQNQLVTYNVSNTNTGSTAAVGYTATANGGTSYYYRTSNAYAVPNTTYLQTAGGSDIIIFQDNANVKFTHGGLVGIGTMSPLNPLTILNAGGILDGAVVNNTSNLYSTFASQLNGTFAFNFGAAGTSGLAPLTGKNFINSATGRNLLFVNNGSQINAEFKSNGKIKFNSLLASKLVYTAADTSLTNTGSVGQSDVTNGYVDLSSAQTIGGAKTFSNVTVFNSGSTFNSAITLNQQLVHTTGYQDIYQNSANTFSTTFGVGTVTANHGITLPDDDGTVALTKNINAFITGTPTIAAGTGAGTSPTVSVTTNGKQLQVTVTTGTLPTGANATIATVTLASALSYTPYPVFSSANAATSLLNGASMVYMTSTGASNVTITAGTTALVAATSYVWNIAL